jgi:hypothetical protein
MISSKNHHVLTHFEVHISSNLTGIRDAGSEANNAYLSPVLKLRMHADLSPSPIHLHWMVLRHRDNLIFTLVR